MLRVKEIAKEKGLTIADVASKMNMHSPALSRIINGGNTTIETLQRIADVLEVDIVELFEKSETNNITIGIIKHNNKTYEVNSIDDIEKLLIELKQTNNAQNTI